jgi:hypothetical protein
MGQAMSIAARSFMSELFVNDPFPFSCARKAVRIRDPSRASDPEVAPSLLEFPWARKDRRRDKATPSGK